MPCGNSFVKVTGLLKAQKFLSLPCCWQYFIILIGLLKCNIYHKTYLFLMYNSIAISTFKEWYNHCHNPSSYKISLIFRSSHVPLTLQPQMTIAQLTGPVGFLFLYVDFVYDLFQLVIFRNSKR